VQSCRHSPVQAAFPGAILLHLLTLLLAHCRCDARSRHQVSYRRYCVSNAVLDVIDRRAEAAAVSAIASGTQHSTMRVATVLGRTTLPLLAMGARPPASPWPSGPGLPPDLAQDALFQRFIRGDKARLMRGNGLDLAAAVARRHASPCR
jgi:hypothetical protein